MKMTSFHVFLGQLSLLWRDPPGNLERLSELLGNVSSEAESLLVLPEMMTTGFTEDLAGLAQPPGGEWERRLQAVVDAHGGVTLAGLARRHGDAIKNEAVWFRPGGDQAEGLYEKIRPFKSEHKVVTAGDEIRVFEHRGAIICPLICYDLRFPELFRAGLRLGAEVFVVIASWPSPRHDHWEGLLRARAVENQAYVIGVNRCGDDPNFHFRGGSMVVDPHGKVVYHAGEEEGIGEVSLDLNEVREWRELFPAVRDYMERPEVGR
jgi:predicted amidohydrolase